MMVGDAYGEVSAQLRDYLRPFGMLADHGPPRVMRELTAGIVFTGSVQRSNAARLFAGKSAQLADAVERMSQFVPAQTWESIKAI